MARPDGGDKEQASAEGGDGGGSTAADVETEYTPRRVVIDEEECDDVAREALTRLREQTRDVAHRAAELEKQERELAAQKLAIEEAAKKAGEKVAELEKLGARIEARLNGTEEGAGPTRQSEKERAEAQAQKEERLQKITAMVGGMSSRRAAQLLASFNDNDLAVAVLQALPREQAGKLLGQMDARKAAILAERIGDGPLAKNDVRDEGQADRRGEQKSDDRREAATEKKGGGPK